MSSRFRVSTTATAVAMLVGSLIFAFHTSAQTQAYRAPRLRGTNNPNLNGIWQALNAANWDIQGHPAQAGPAAAILGAYTAVPAGLGVVEGSEIPYQPWAAAKKQENFEKRLTAEPDPPEMRYVGDPELKCFLPGVPRATYMPFPFQIIQSPNANVIMIAYEYASAVRVLNMSNHIEAPVDSWMGWSNGHWDGDTLVVDVTGFNGYAWFDRAGNFASNALHVIERYTPVGPDHLQYEATIEDPKVFTHPWKMRMPLYRRKETNVQLLEFKCVEFTEELLLGRFRKQQTQ